MGFNSAFKGLKTASEVTEQNCQCMSEIARYGGITTVSAVECMSGGKN
jgi:hypothetical protein